VKRLANMSSLFRALAVGMVFIGILVGAPTGAIAVQPDEILSDPELEKRARTISLDLRCLVCQNQSIDDSDAPLARDLRLLVRERLQKGETNTEVIDFVVSRYGEFVLLKPPFGWHTLLLWLAPVLALAGGIWLARSVFVGNKLPDESDEPSIARHLSVEEEAELKRLLGEEQTDAKA